MDDKLIEQIVQQVVAKLDNDSSKLTPEGPIPIAVSARHIHLKKEHVEILFGKGYEITKKQDLSQPGQFAANETLMIAGPKGSIERVRILGPVRPESQVEVALTDAFKLGVRPPLRESGNIEGSSPITLIGPKGTVHLQEGLIIAQSHIHMNPEEAKILNLKNGEYVNITAQTERPMTFNQVKIRVSDRYRLEMHIDTDEANAAFITQGTKGSVVRSGETINLKTDKHIINGLENSVNRTVFSEKESIITYDKKLLSKEVMEKIDANIININKQTIVTALARDYAREKNIKIKIV